MWAARIVHEAGDERNPNGSHFITLTYNNQNIPDDWSLDKTHFQKFIKRLRKSQPGNKIRYYHAGEYGNRCRHGILLEEVGCPSCRLGRPHYHACIFNAKIDDLRRWRTGGFYSPKIERIWGMGFVDVGKLEYESAAYVARYVTKKITGKNAEEHYTYVDPVSGEITKLQPEYATMSNGIGAAWYARYKDDFFPRDEVPVAGQGVFKKVPRFYEEIYKKEDPEGHHEMKEARLAYRQENSEEYTRERLHQKYKVKKAETDLRLSRGLE